MARVIFETWILSSKYFDHPSLEIREGKGGESTRVEYTLVHNRHEVVASLDRNSRVEQYGLIKNVILTLEHVAGSSFQFWKLDSFERVTRSSRSPILLPRAIWKIDNKHARVSHLAERSYLIEWENFSRRKRVAFRDYIHENGRKA